MCKICWTLVVLLALVTGVAGYVFIIKGETVAGSDGRTVIVLDQGERSIILAEMRAFLESVQAITVAVAREDMAGVAVAARKVGAAAQQEVPASLVKKLPTAFKKLGFSTHQAFDQLALDAESFGDKEQTLEALGELMLNCVGCHAAYQIQLEAGL